MGTRGGVFSDESACVTGGGTDPDVTVEVTAARTLGYPGGVVLKDKCPIKLLTSIADCLLLGPTPGVRGAC